MSLLLAVELGGLPTSAHSHLEMLDLIEGQGVIIHSKKGSSLLRNSYCNMTKGCRWFSVGKEVVL